MILSLYILLTMILCLAWVSPTKTKDSPLFKLIKLLLLIAILIIVIFRNGALLPDYANYVSNFHNTAIRSIEVTFGLIVSFAKSYISSSDPIGMFAIYAIISILIKFYAIGKYSKTYFYSMAVWCCSLLILHEMIQIRAAVAASLMLLIIPACYKKEYLKAIILIVVAFLFHRSALIFVVFLFLNKTKSYFYFWFIGYAFFFCLNILNIFIFDFLGISAVISNITLMDGDIYNLGKEALYSDMLGRYIVLQALVSFLCLYNYKKIIVYFPNALLYIKASIIGVIIYSLPLMVVAGRLSELFSTAHIFVFPFLLYILPKFENRIIGKIALTAICFIILTTFIYSKDYIAH